MDRNSLSASTNILQNRNTLGECHTFRIVACEICMIDLADLFFPADRFHRGVSLVVFLFGDLSGPSSLEQINTKVFEHGILPCEWCGRKKITNRWVQRAWHLLIVRTWRAQDFTCGNKIIVRCPFHRGFPALYCTLRDGEVQSGTKQSYLVGFSGFATIA